MDKNGANEARRVEEGRRADRELEGLLAEAEAAKASDDVSRQEAVEGRIERAAAMSQGMAGHGIRAAAASHALGSLDREEDKDFRTNAGRAGNGEEPRQPGKLLERLRPAITPMPKYDSGIERTLYGD